MVLSTLQPWSTDQAVEEVALWINRNEQKRNIEDFEPLRHKKRRWLAIAHVILHATRGLSQSFILSSCGRSPFWEVLEYVGSEQVGVDWGDLITPAIDANAAIELYERLLHEDFPIRIDTGASNNRAVARRNAGAFYTPSNLAEGCVKVACEVYIEKRLGISSFLELLPNMPIEERRRVIECLCAARVLDATCGAGQFLVQYSCLVGGIAKEYLERKESEKAILMLIGNLYGVDVDPIALGLARLSLYIRMASLLGAQFDSTALAVNICLGNPLVRGEQVLDVKKALDEVISGGIYSDALSRPQFLEDMRFEVVLGNPPWEKIRLEERDFFSHLREDLDIGTTRLERDQAIEQIRKRLPAVYAYYQRISRGIELGKSAIRQDPWFEKSAHGELNTSALFTELGSRVMSEHGVLALLIKTSTLTHYANRKLFDYLRSGMLIHSVFDFTNREKLFPIDSRERFSLLMLSAESAEICLALSLVAPLDLFDRRRRVRLTYSDLWKLNPATGMILTPTNPYSLSVLRHIYRLNQVFSSVRPNAKFGRLVHLTMHAKHIVRSKARRFIGLQEGKFIERYDGRFSTFDGISESMCYTARAASRRITAEEKRDPTLHPQPRYFLDEETWQQITKNHTEAWSIFWRSTTSATNARTCIATILPHSPAIQSLQMVQLPGASCEELAIVLAVLNSKVFDFVLRNKLAGIDLTQAVIKQAAFPPEERWEESLVIDGVKATLGRHVAMLVAKLLADDSRLARFVAEIDAMCCPPATRTKVVTRLDDLVSIAYGLDENMRDEIYALHTQ